MFEKLAKIWRVLAFFARMINTIEDIYLDIKATFFEADPPVEETKKSDLGK